VDRHGEPHVTDFGLAKKVTADSGLTLSGEVVGTPSFMAPEQAAGQGKHLTTAADVYSLGAVLYELLTGRPPFHAETLMETLRQVIDNEPARPSTLNPKLDRDLDTICLKCLEKKPEQRYGSAEALADELERWLNHEPILARPVTVPERVVKWARRRPAVAGLVAVSHVAAAVVGVLLLLHQAELKRERDVAKQAQQQAETAEAKSEVAQKETQQTAMRLRLESARYAFDSGEISLGLAQLAYVLRQDPKNLAVSEWLLSALTLHQHCLPTYRRLEISGDAPAAAMHVRPDRGLAVIVESGGRHARIRDTRSGKPLTNALEHPAAIQLVIFSADGQRVLTTAADRVVRQWDTATGLPAGSPVVSSDPVTAAGFSANGRRIFTTSTDRTARVWDAQTGQSVGQPLSHDKAVNFAELSPDGSRMVTGISDRVARLWDIHTGGKPLELKHGDRVNAAAFSPDGERLATVSSDKTARLWDVLTGRQLGEPMPHLGLAKIAAFSPDGNRLITGADEPYLRMWDAYTGRSLGEGLRHGFSRPKSVAFNAGGGTLFAQIDARSYWTWDVRPSRALPLLIRLSQPMRDATFSPDGTRVAIAAGTNLTQIWNAETGQPTGAPLITKSEGLAARFSPDGAALLTLTSGSAVQLWETQTGKLRGELSHLAKIRAAVFSHDGGLIATASSDGTARVWDGRTGQPLSQPLAHGKDVFTARFSPDGRIVLTGSADRMARLWDAGNGQLIAEPLEHGGGSVWDARFSPDGRRIVTMCSDRAARVWERQSTNKPSGQSARWTVVALMRHEADLTTAVFSSNGRRVLTASADRTARIWNAQTGQLTPGLPHRGTVVAAEFSPDGTRVLTASDDHTARLWDARTGHPITEPLRHDGPLSSARFSPDGRRVVTASVDKTARVWDVPPVPSAAPDWLIELAEVLAQRTFKEDGTTDPVRPTVLEELKQRVTSNADDFYTRWAKWFFDDRSKRALSPF